jgi:hypothetical protein
LLKPGLELKLKNKIEDTTEKLKTVRGSYTVLDVSIHAKKGP